MPDEQNNTSELSFPESHTEDEQLMIDTSPTEAETPQTTTHSPVPVVPQLAVALLILVSLFSVSIYAGKERPLPPAPLVPASDVTATLPDEPIATTENNLQDPFEGVAVVADAAFVWDVRTQRALFTKSPDEQLPLASITKLMTALVAYELLEEGDSIHISKEAIREMGNSGFTDGERFNFKNLTDLTLIGSSNDGAHALASAAAASITQNANTTALFVDAMNIRAEEIGLSQTYFNNPTGLDVSTSQAGAYGSARDVTFLMEYILTHYPALLDETTEESAVIENEDGEGHLVKNTNNAIRDIQGLIASKTGYTDLAGGNLVVAFEAGLNHPIIITVLGSTYSDRFSDVVLLEKRAREALSQ